MLNPFKEERMAGVKPKKALGQHFLTDLNVADRIASTLDAYVDIPVLAGRDADVQSGHKSVHTVVYVEPLSGGDGQGVRYRP